MKMNEREEGIVIAGLRIFQNKLSGNDSSESYNDLIRCYFTEHRIDVPTEEDIEDLLEKLFGGDE